MRIKVTVVRSILLGAIALFIFSACSTSSPVRYFSLNASDANFAQDSDDAVMLGLGPIRMPDYLNRSQIVWRGANAEMLVDEFSRWTEPLSTSLLRVVSTDVDKLLDDVVVVVYPYEPFVRDQIDYRLIGDVNRFDADDSGNVVLEVQWGIADVDGEVLIPVRRNRYQTQASTAQDPGAVVMAMNNVLAQFSNDIANKLKAKL